MYQEIISEDTFIAINAREQRPFKPSIILKEFVNAVKKKIVKSAKPSLEFIRKSIIGVCISFRVTPKNATKSEEEKTIANKRFIGETFRNKSSRTDTIKVGMKASAIEIRKKSLLIKI
jgi:hypothetical protein